MNANERQGTRRGPTLVLATRNADKAQEIRAILGGRFGYLTLHDFPGAPKVVEDAATFAGNATKKAVELARWLAFKVQSSKFKVQSSKLTVHGSQADGQWPRRAGREAPGEVASGPGGVEASASADVAALSGSGERWFVLADDSGLEVDALGGAPGVHSARFAAAGKAGADNSSPADNNTRLLRLLAAVPLEKRTARFRCVLALTPVGCGTGPAEAGPAKLGQDAQATGSLRPAASPVCAADEFELMTELFEGACEGRITFAPRGEGGFGYDPLFVPLGYDQTFAELGQAVKNQLSHRARALARLGTRLETSGSAFSL